MKHALPRLLALGAMLMASLSACGQTANDAGLSIEPAELARLGHWPSFRGPFACGVADNQNLPDKWSCTNSAGVLWKRRISGLAHSSPILWGNKLFVTTAVSSRGVASFRPGLYGDGDASDDRSSHQWLVICLDKRTGDLLWERTAAEGAPKDKRHIKATYANSTPATDGRCVVALFGSEGLFGYDLDGNLLWKKDLGRLNAGAYNGPSYEWGAASSPILYRNMAIVQCDIQQGSFIMAVNAKTGDTIWRSSRDELPGWGTPTVYPGKQRPELVTNGSNLIRGYDPATGLDLWRLGGSSKITAPTPIFGEGMIVVASGRTPEKPIFAIRPGASGDITPGQEESSTRFVAWHKTRKGPYMPTPLIYRGLLYVLNNNGYFEAYDLASGTELYSHRIPHRGSGFSASPVAADGWIYLPSEDGEVFVVRAGKEFRLDGQHDVGELLMATPALSEGRMYIRAQGNLFAIGR